MGTQQNSGNINSEDVPLYLGIAVYLNKSYLKTNEKALRKLCYHWKNMAVNIQSLKKNGFQLVIY